ncbi:ABC transporter permease [Geomicrobium sediminis]|uniref:ABC transport system permease protein n=1 Tax=Geomicrobium sediminis TaxID=1347788 RepID=A0ABS2P8M8_9BACL|nr:ABC transporter permease [Geomicrobium sediminis]MBM7631706.1 putative ABC transport system permease protein [Geomicrobium sediminis]
MFTALFGSVELGLIYGIMALGVYLSFRVLNFPDLTVDGSFVTGGAVAAIMIVSGYSPILATLAAVGAGFIAGSITGTLHAKGKINPLLSGILMMIALYSINLRIMGNSPNIPLMREDTIMTMFQSFWATLPFDGLMTSLFTTLNLPFTPSTWGILLFAIMIVIVVKLFTDFFLSTEVGLAIRATGDNPRMISSLSANTDRLKILGLGISNAFVALSGAIVTQYSSFVDVNMGIGMIIIGLASVIIGEAIFGKGSIFKITIAVIVGAVIYRMVVALALRVGFLETGDMKLITAIIVIGALVVPRLLENGKERRRKYRKARKIKEQYGGEKSVAATKSDL